MYVLIAGILTVATMIYIAKRMQARPNRVQTAVEILFALMRDNITRGNMDDQMAAKWFPFIGTLFLFIWFSNLIGYIPLPTNTEHKIDIFGLEIPSFALYAATANLVDPAGARAGRLGLLQHRGRPGEGLRRLPQEPRSRRASAARCCC